MVKDLSARTIDGLKFICDFLPIYGSLQREKMSEIKRYQTQRDLKTIIQTGGSAMLISIPPVIMCLYAISDSLSNK